MAQLGFGPPALPVGTDVSAKYRGAFCEAKVKDVVRVVKCKVVMKDCQSSIVLLDDQIKGPIKLGSVVEVKHPDTGQPVEATINKLIDQSSYTVVFDDGDERTLRRTQLCLKGDKHFIESETLDNLPLSHPEHFGTPVLQNKKLKKKASDDSDDADDASEEESPRRALYRGRHQELVGKLMLVDLPQRKGVIFPALVVLPDASSIGEVKSRDQILVRSFKDSKFSVVTRKELKDFTRSIAIKNDDKNMRIAYEKALLFYDTKELPVGWKREDMLGSDVDDDNDDIEEDEYASEDEPFEEKDRFVAQLYKFMDDRGTPINKGPSIANKDLNLYKLFKIVQNLGGYNKVTREMKWPVVYSKMGLPSLHLNPTHQIKTAYKKYLLAYEAFYRKLGSTMGTHTRPGRARHSSGRGILFRARDKTLGSPKQTDKAKDEAGSPKPKVEQVVEKSEDINPDASSSVLSVEENDSLLRRVTPRRDSRLQGLKEETKDIKAEVTPKIKKEDKYPEELKKSKKEESTKIKKEEPPKAKKDVIKDDLTKAIKKEDGVKVKKEDTKIIKKEDTIPRVRKDPSPTPKPKKLDVPRVRRDEEAIKKEERKSSRKNLKDDEKDREIDKEDKKPIRSARKEKDEDKNNVKTDETDTASKDAPKKRATRRKLIPTEGNIVDCKGDLEEKKELSEAKEMVKKMSTREPKIIDKKQREIPRTLERRDSKGSEKKELSNKAEEKKETKGIEKKQKPDEKIKSIRDNKGVAYPESENDETSEKSSEESDPSKEIVSKRDFALGSKLKVKYGKGKNQKTYIAKVVNHGMDGCHKTFKVHYAGWNTRYDEWIRAERVVAVLERGDNAKHKPSSTTPILSAKKVTSAFQSKLKTKPNPGLKKANPIFRTPKSVLSKARATRSSSSEISVLVLSKKPGKPTTRRRSGVTDSDSKSSEGQVSSDGEEGPESEPADECSVIKPEDEEEEEDEEEDDMLEVEIDEDMDMLKTSDIEVTDCETNSKESLMSTNTSSEMIACEIPSVLQKDADLDVDDSPENDGPSIEVVTTSPTDDILPCVEDKNSSESDNLPIVVENFKREPVKTIKATVPLKEINDSCSEIKYGPYEYAMNFQDDEINDKKEAKHSKEETADLNADDDEEIDEFSTVEVLDEEEETSKESLNEDLLKIENLKEKEASLSSPPPIIDQAIPQLKKIDVDIKEKESEKSKIGKGKKNVIKDVKKPIKSLDLSGSSGGEIPTLEAIVEAANTVADNVEPSPYDFDDEEEAETPWQPEITKKWEPSQKTLILQKDNESCTDEEIEKEKKKTKKKSKKRPITPAFVEESSSNNGPSPKSGHSDKLSNSTIEDKMPIKKKGRKKKDSFSNSQKSSEICESSVNSVVEAVKNSLQESNPENLDKKSPFKKRRMKRASESDKKDLHKVQKVGKKAVSKDTLDIVDSVTSSIGGKKDVTNSRLVPTSSSSVSPKNNLSSSVKKDSLFVKERTRSSYSEGFEPQKDDSSAHFDNTPPTTPEHDEAECVPSAHQKDSSGVSEDNSKTDVSKAVYPSATSSSSSLSLPSSSSTAAQSKSASESPSDNDMTSTASTDNMDVTITAQQSESSGAEQEFPVKKRKRPEDQNSSLSAPPKKKKRIHGTRSRTAKKSPKYIGTDSSVYKTDSQGSSSTTPNHCPDSPLTKFTDLTKSPRPSKYNFNADLGEYLEGEARCNFLINKMKEIKTIYMNLKSEVASIDRRRKRLRRKERETSHVSMTERDVST